MKNTKIRRQVSPTVRHRSRKQIVTDVPEWVTSTMGEPIYTLEVMCDCGDCTLEQIDLTRDEFIALKRHLAKMRGYAVPEDSHAEQETVNANKPTDDVADMLEEFRDNWDAMSRDVARFIESYPSEVPHAAK